MDNPERTAMIKTTFDTVARGYDNRALRFFQDSARHLTACLDLTGREHVLDVATGTGIVALRLAQDLPHGQITGIDLSSGMLAQAKKKAEALKLHNVTFLEMDMQSIGFPNDRFDASVCGFGIFFVQDMESQLKHISAKTKPGCRVAISCFDEQAFSPLADMFLSRIRKYGVTAPPLPWKRIGTEAKCAALCQDAGLVGVRVIRRDLGYYLSNVREWWDVIWWGGFRRFVSRLSPSALEAFRAEHLREVEPLTTGDGIRLNLNVLYAMGTKPPAASSCHRPRL
jgi:ubiquinone/menaquinone biosynthesis C-methylase UbiE